MKQEDCDLLVGLVKEMRANGVASFEVKSADFEFKALISPQVETPLNEAERHALLESPEVSEARKRELKREEDLDLYGSA